MFLFLYCYFWLISISVNCSFKMWFQLLLSFWISLKWLRDNQNRNFVSVIGNVVSWFASVDITLFINQVTMRLVSQLINDISKVLQNYLNISKASLFQHLSYHKHLLICYFCLTFKQNFIIIIAIIRKVNKTLKLVYFCSTAINFYMFWNDYHYILRNNTLELLHQCLWALSIFAWLFLYLPKYMRCLDLIKQHICHSCFF